MHAADGGYGYAAAHPSCMILAAAYDEMPASVRAENYDPVRSVYFRSFQLPACTLQSNSSDPG